MKQETFKFINNLEGRYSVSSEGRVFSHLTGQFRVPVLTKRLTSGGDQVKLNLCKANRTKTYRLKRLVAEAFIPNPSNKPCVIHINGDITDCRASNLRWSTQSEVFNHVFTDEVKLNNLKDANRRRLSRPVINDLTGLVYPSAASVEQLCGLPRGFATKQINKLAYQTNKQYRFRYLEESR